MRNLDNKNTYYYKNKPLLGRLRFCNLDGSATTIYDSLGNLLPNPILTNNSGQTKEQVFLADHDYLIFADLYVGSGTMSEFSPENNWLQAYSWVNKRDIATFDSGTDVAFVADVDALRSLSTTGHDYVTLLGYNAPGDKPQAVYWWDSSNSSSDNGGSIIKPSTVVGNGRWVMIPSTNNVDVRHFGVFPKSSKTTDSTQRLGLSNAITYANSLGLPIYLSSNSGNTYYDIGNLTISNIECDSNVRVHVGSTYTATINNGEQVHAVGASGDGTITINGKVLRASQAVSRPANVTLNASERLVLDAAWQGTVNGITIELTWNFDNTGCDFTNCTFVGTGKFASNIDATFRKCHVYGSMFVNETITNATFIQCNTNVSDWGDASTFIEIMVDSGNKIIELAGRSTTRSLPSVDTTYKLYNAVHGFPSNVTNWEFHGCTMFVGTGAATTHFTSNNFKLFDCTVTGNPRILNNSGFTGYFYGCTFESTGGIAGGGTTVELYDASATTFPSANVTLRRCNFLGTARNPISINMNALPLATVLSSSGITVVDCDNVTWNTDGFTVEATLPLSTSSTVPVDPTIVVAPVSHEGGSATFYDWARVYNYRPNMPSMFTGDSYMVECSAKPIINSTIGGNGNVYFGEYKWNPVVVRPNTWAATLDSTKFPWYNQSQIYEELSTTWNLPFSQVKFVVKFTRI